MRERLTFIVPENSQDPDPAGVDFRNDSSVVFYDAEEASTFQHRIIADLAELPTELQAALKATDELHIRWSCYTNIEFQTYSRDEPPFNSRLPAGLHVFAKESGAGFTNLCKALDAFLGVKCDDVATSFSTLPRTGSDPIQQYYQPYDSLRNAQSQLNSTLCAADDEFCHMKVTDYPRTVDIDYDSNTKTITVSALYNVAPDFAFFAIPHPKPGDRTEVGFFKNEKYDVPDWVRLGGYLLDLGAADKTSPTLFDFPSRHQFAAPPASISFEQPTGLHPRLNIRFKPSRPLPGHCSLHAYFTLPSALFIDRYQFSDPVALASQGLLGLRSLTGEDDLEAPDWVVKKWGSTALFDLAVPTHLIKDNPLGWDVTIPMHLRYMAAENNTDSVKLKVPHPTLFWACAETNPDIDLFNNPFDRINLGYDYFFPPRTKFYHIDKIDSWNAYETIQVPVLNPSANQWVPFGTLISVLLGFAWICWKLLAPQAQQQPIVVEKKPGLDEKDELSKKRK